jgi:hypothetical protein
MRRHWSLLALLAAAVLVTPLLGVLDVGVAWAALLAAALLALVWAARRDDGRARSESVWEFVPSWQYTGRHVESGGLARDEQEAALADVAEQAASRGDSVAERERH